MFSIIITLIAGLIIGSLAGFFIMAILIAAARTDSQMAAAWAEQEIQQTKQEPDRQILSQPSAP